MRFAIDTSSLLAITRYYLPFDRDSLLKNLLLKKVKNKEIIILDEVAIESKRTAQGVIVKNLDFVDNKEYQLKTDLLLPTQKFLNDLENRLCYAVKKKELSDAEFENRENQFLKSADAKLVIFCLSNKNQLGLDNHIVVTEETRAENDNKLFKKIPEMCNLLGIEHCNVTALLKEYYHVKMDMSI